MHKQKISKLHYLILGILTPLTILFAYAPATRLRTLDDYIVAIYQRQHFSEEVDFESIKQALQEAYAKPLDLNSITQTALEELGILSDNQIKEFFNHIATTGPLYSRYELQAIPDFDLDTISLLLPFVSVSESYTTPLPKHPIMPSRNHYGLLRYLPAWCSRQHHGITQPLGSLDQWLFRLELKDYHRITIGISANKQPGEHFTWDHATHRYGFNLWSIFLLLTPNKYVQQLIIGDYQIGYGQGLLLATGYTMDKRADIISMFRSNNVGICPYRGIKRKGFRGIALRTHWGAIALTAFYANHNLDATLHWDDLHLPYARSIANLGCYDTPQNLQKKGTLHEQVVGCTLRLPYVNNQREFGIQLLYHYYAIPVLPKKSPFSHYLFQGQHRIATGLFYRLLWHNSLFFGEGAITYTQPYINYWKHDHAWITGAIISLSHYIDLSTGWYYYGKNFSAPYGHPFKYYSTMDGNEQGIYGGIQWRPLPDWQLSVKNHFFATLRPKPQLDTTGHGYGVITRSSRTWHRTTTWICQHSFYQIPKSTKCYESATQDQENRAITLVNKNNLKFSLAHTFPSAWKSAVAIQYSHHGWPARVYHGYALSVSQKVECFRLQLSGKITYFKTDHYTVRLYIYEPGPLYGALFKPYSGHGLATIFVILWKPTSYIQLALKYRWIYYWSDGSLAKAQRSSPDKQMGALQCIFHF